MSGEESGAQRAVSHLHGCLRTGDRILEGFGLQQAHQFSGRSGEREGLPGLRRGNAKAGRRHGSGRDTVTQASVKNTISQCPEQGPAGGFLEQGAERKRVVSVREQVVVAHCCMSVCKNFGAGKRE